MEGYRPPTVPEKTPNHTYVYSSPIPSGIKPGSSIIIGIDEAGRGPLIGPMVYSLAYCGSDFGKEQLPKCEFADSKVLNDSKRRELMREVSDGYLAGEIGYSITALSALDISCDMMRPVGHVVNLNEQAHDTTIKLIRGVVDVMKKMKVGVDAVYVDTVGPPVSYQAKLRKFFNEEEVKVIKVEKKADAIYPIVSAASVVAKVTRDVICESVGEAWGSGYPGDPKTVKWVRENVHGFWGWNDQIRYSWGTARTALEKNGAIAIEWEHELVKRYHEDEDVEESQFVGKEWFF